MENDAHHQPYRVSPVVHNDYMINMTSFYLIRHAHADYLQNEQRPLSEKGQADAERVAGLLGSYAITQIYSSPYQRAVQTVSPLAKKLNLEIVIEPDLRERCLAQGVVDGDFITMVQQTWEAPFFAFQGGESNLAAQERGVGVIHRLSACHPNGRLVLSTHGNLMCLILQFFFKHINFEFWKSLSMPDIYTFSQENKENNLTRLWQS
jgi:2,3-bisphosphoglycerate-dependent phosphoglycerate mutase